MIGTRQILDVKELLVTPSKFKKEFIIMNILKSLQHNLHKKYTSGYEF